MPSVKNVRLLHDGLHRCHRARSFSRSIRPILQYKSWNDSKARPSIGPFDRLRPFGDLDDYVGLFGESKAIFEHASPVRHAMIAAQRQNVLFENGLQDKRKV